MPNDGRAGAGGLITVVLPVTPGNELILYAGQDARGRMGGYGYRNGGDGGMGSTSSTTDNSRSAAGGGGGGSSAVVHYVSLLAVAGGGGGAGGRIRTSDGILEGGRGASPGAPATEGQGLYPGRAGSSFNYLHPDLRGQGQDGMDGRERTYSGGGGGGGGSSETRAGARGGGGGWGEAGLIGIPTHTSSGGGGGAGFTEGYGNTVLTPVIPEVLTGYNGPVAVGTSAHIRVSIPMRTEVKATAPSTVVEGTAFTVSAEGIHSNYQPSPVPVSGTFVVKDVNGVQVATGSGSPASIDMPGLDVGTHEFTVYFSPDVESERSGNFTYGDHGSQTTFTVTATKAPPPPATTQTTLTVPHTSTVGDSPQATVRVSATPGIPGGTVPSLAGDPIILSVDGNETVATLDASGEAVVNLGALTLGDHQITATYAGKTGVTGSTSAIATLTVLPAASTTTLNAPGATPFGTPIDAEVTVTHPATLTASGEVALLAGGDTLATVPLATDGTAHFTSNIIPWGVTELSAQYIATPESEVSGSQSPATPFEVTALPTTTTLDSSVTSAVAGEQTVLTARVATNGTTDLDPVGSLEFLLDGTVFAQLPADADHDAIADNGVALFEYTLPLDEPMTGELSARFVATDGFTGSSSPGLPIEVLAWNTSLTASASEVVVDHGQPAIVTANVSATPPRETQVPQQQPSGTVRAYIGGVLVAGPVPTVDGAAQLPLDGIAVGVHRVELRFEPGWSGWSTAATDIELRVNRVADGTDGPGGSPEPGGSHTPEQDDPPQKSETPDPIVNQFPKQQQAAAGSATTISASHGTLATTGDHGSGATLMMLVALLLLAAGTASSLRSARVRR